MEQAHHTDGRQAGLDGKDFLTGAIFLALGAFVMFYGSRYPMGTAVRMGPGYFPLLVASGLALLGVGLLIRALIRPDEAINALSLRPLVAVLLATLAFALLIDRAGFWLASLALVVTSRFAERGAGVVEVAGLALVLTTIVTAIFRLGLGLPLRLLPF
jgi:putative tricarboxylic transport membrane protein